MDWKLPVKFNCIFNRLKYNYSIQYADYLLVSVDAGAISE